MKQVFFACLLIILISCQVNEKPLLASQGLFQLASPHIEIDSVLFKSSAKINISLDLPGVQIFYATNQDDVTSRDVLYNTSLEFNQSGRIEIRAFHSDYLPSDLVVKEVIKVRDFSKKASLTITPPAHSNYPGEGSQSLLDLKKGTTNFRQNQFWMGFQSKTVVLELDFEKSEKIEEVILSTLKDQASWIFLPERIQLISSGNIIVEKVIEQPSELEPASLEFFTLKLPQSISTKSLSIKIINRSSIPEWHAGKGSLPWLFVDEVLIN